MRNPTRHATSFPAQLRTALAELPQTVAVAWLVARRDLVSEWRSSRLSVFWPLLYPVSYTALFVALRPLIQGADVPITWTYVLHVFIGFSLWQVWFDGMRIQMEAVRSNRSLLATADLNPATIFLAGFIVQVVHLLSRIVLALAAVLVFSESLSIYSAVVFSAMSIFVVLNGCTAGFVLQPFSTLLPDVGKAIQTVSLALLVSGGIFIVIPTDVDSAMVSLLAINPLGPLVEAARAPMLGQAHVFKWAAHAWVVLTLIVLLLQIVLARKVLPILLERIGA